MIEPWFTFRAGIPPHRLREMSLCQIADHIAYHNDMAREGG